MRRVVINMVLFSVLGCLLEASGQEPSAQEDYVNSTQEKHAFNKKKWGSLKDLLINESDGTYNSGDRGVKGSYYNYDNEDYDGKNGEHNNEDDQYSNKRDQAFSKEGGHKNEGGVGYKPKEDNAEYGQQGYHPREKQPQQTNRNNNNVSIGDDMGFLQYVLFGLLTVLLGFLIYQLFFQFSFDDKGSKVISDFEELAPTQIPKSELELMLEKALAKDDFRGVIRLYFIFIIKVLNEKEWIRWEKEKTNFSYLMEMRGKPQYESFIEAVSIYELVWYGNYTVKKEDFSSLEPKFKGLLNNLHFESR